MKCPVCKYLNVREEARKHPNVTTMRTMLAATPALKTQHEAIIGVVFADCKVHQDAKTLVRHFANIGCCAKELAALSEQSVTGKVLFSEITAILNKYPLSEIDKEEVVSEER